MAERRFEVPITESDLINDFDVRAARSEFKKNGQEHPPTHREIRVLNGHRISETIFCGKKRGYTPINRVYSGK